MWKDDTIFRHVHSEWKYEIQRPVKGFRADGGRSIVKGSAE
jgi:hypothetical protein